MPQNSMNVLVSRNEIGYFAHCPGLSGCHGLGDTPEEAFAGFMASLEIYATTLPPGQGHALLSRPVRPGAQA